MTMMSNGEQIILHPEKEHTCENVIASAQQGGSPFPWWAFIRSDQKTPTPSKFLNFKSYKLFIIYYRILKRLKSANNLFLRVFFGH